MVKIKFEIAIKRDSPQKRARGLKQKPKKENQSKNKENQFQGNSEPNHQSENNLLFLSNRNYSPEIRYIVLFRLYRLIEQINDQIKLPENLVFSTIALLDNYLNKSSKYINPKEMELALYACLDILDKEQNINVFSNSYFEKFIDFELEFDILEVVDLEVYPEKLYDYFNKFYYYELLQGHDENKIELNYLNEFKKHFLHFGFLAMFNIDSFDKKPFRSFLYCALMAFEKAQLTMPKEADFLKGKINEMMYINGYIDNEFYDFKSLINVSIKIFNNLVYSY